MAPSRSKRWQDTNGLVKVGVFLPPADALRAKQAAAAAGLSQSMWIAALIRLALRKVKTP